MSKRVHVKYLLFLSDLNKTWLLSTDFRKKKAQISSFTKIRQVEADRRTDGNDEANSRFSQFCERA